MVYFAVLSIVLLAYLAYKLFIKPLRQKAFYSKMFRAQGYKVFQYPYSAISAPFYTDYFQSQKQKNDFNYTGKHVYSDSYDLVISNVFNKPELVFFNEKFIKAFLDKDLQMALPKLSIGFTIVAYIAKKGLVFLEKNAWKSRRTLLSKVFNFDFIVSQIPTMIQSANKIFQRFQEQYWKVNPQKRQQKLIKLNLYDLIAKYTSSIIIAGFLGDDLLKEKIKGKQLQEQILRLTYESAQLSKDTFHMMFGQHFLKLGLRKTDRQFVAFNQEINQVLRTSIQGYRQQSKQAKKTQKKQSKNIVQLIFEEVQRNKDGQKHDQGINDDDFVDQVKTFVIAGTDTTSNYLTMLILHIYEHQQVLQKLRTQIAKHIQTDEHITLQNIKKITYLDCVLTESSRVLGATEGGFERELQQDVVFCDIPLKKGTCLNIYTRPLFANPNIFKDPLSFKPERWQVQSQQTKKLQQLISLQFYGGPRGCIGKQLALTQAKIGVIKFLRRYKNLVQPGIHNRVYQLRLTAHLGAVKSFYRLMSE